MCWEFLAQLPVQLQAHKMHVYNSFAGSHLSGVAMPGGHRRALNDFDSRLTAPGRSVECKMPSLGRKGRGMICVNTWRSGSSSHPQLLPQDLLKK